MEELTKTRTEDLKSLLLEVDSKDIENRMKVVEKLWNSETHVNLDDVYQSLENNGEKIDKGFIEDTLILLSRLGLVNKIEMANQSVRYEPKYLGEHHDHMICVECGKIIEFEDLRLERIQNSVAEKYDFSLIRHKVEFYGFCSQCSSKRGEELLLQNARAGERLEVTSVKGGSGLNKKLASMAISKGSVLEVLNANKGGQLIVACGESRYVLGKGITDKVFVKRIHEEKCLMGQNPACPYINKSSDSFVPGCRGAAVPLTSLKDGDKGQIIRTGGCKRLRRRLFEMGLLNGAEFEVVKYAPLKDPLEIIVKGSHISLRIDEARHIMVKKDNG
jgi:Fur family ferric uptake transcriptional regulator